MTNSDEPEHQPNRPEPPAPEQVIQGRARLYRSEEDRILGGVAAGLAEHFDTDPVIVRLLWVLTVLFAGIGALAYLVLWIVLPPYSRIYENSDGAPADPPVRRARKPRSRLRTDLVFGAILILLGGLLLIGNIGVGPGWDLFGRLWPLLLIAPAAVIVTPRGGRLPSTGVLLVGGVLLTVGLISLMGSLNIWWGYSAWGRLWPLVLLAIGAAFVFPRLDRGG